MLLTKILLIEDDDLAAEIISNYLSDCGFKVKSVVTATDGIAQLKQTKYDLVILDISLPDFTGFELLKSIKNHISLPIIITSAHSDTKSKVMAFKYGASDYMVKPLDIEELEARIWVQLGKYSEIKTSNEKDIFLLRKNQIFFQDTPLDLTTIEFSILSYLIEYKNNIIPRDDLVSSLSSISSHRSLDNHIKNIRKKIGDNGKNATYLKTEYGVGYKLLI